MLNNKLASITQLNRRIFDINLVKTLEIDTHSVTTDKIIEILNTDFKSRTPEDLAILNYFCLKKTRVYTKFKKENIDNSSYERIILLSQTSATYKKITTPNSFVYNETDNSHFLYIILRGTANVLKLEKMTKKMIGYSYFKLLLDYRNKNNVFLCQQTILMNNGIFPVDINDLYSLEKILLKIYLLEYEIEIINDDLLEALVNKSGLSYSNFNLETYRQKLFKENLEIQKFNEEKIKEKNFFQQKQLLQYNAAEAKKIAEDNLNVLFQNLKDISEEKCHNYSFFKEITEINIIYYKYEEVNSLYEGDYFGDERNGKYMHSIISTSDELELYLMKNDILNQYINIKLTKNLHYQVLTLLKNYFFTCIPSYTFKLLYFNLFDIDCFRPGDILCHENEKVDKIYFIKSGKVKLISNKTIREVNELNKKINSKMNKNNGDDDIVDEDEINILDEKIDISKIKNDLDKKLNIHLITYQENQCIGYESVYFDLNYLYTAIPCESVEVFKLSVKNLMYILGKTTSKKYLEFGSKAEKNILFLLNRFIQAINMNINFYNKSDKKEIDKKKVSKENELLYYKKLPNYKLLKNKILPYLINKNKSQNENNQSTNNVLIKKLNFNKYLKNNYDNPSLSTSRTRFKSSDYSSYPNTSRVTSVKFTKVDDIFTKRLKKLRQIKDQNNTSLKLTQSQINFFKTYKNNKSNINKSHSVIILNYNDSVLKNKENNKEKYNKKSKILKKNKVRYNYGSNISLVEEICKNSNNKMDLSEKKNKNTNELSTLNLENIKKYLISYKNVDYNKMKEKLKKEYKNK